MSYANTVKCTKKNPAECRLHGSTALIEQAKVTGDFETYYQARTKLEKQGYKDITGALDQVGYMVKAGQEFQKTAIVKARQATTPTRVETVLADGTKETNNVALPGDWIVENPGGEKYVIKDETFKKRYSEIESGVFRASGRINAIRNPFNTRIELLAPWGEKQKGEQDCWLAIPVDSDETPYIIGATEFQNTYQVVK